MLRHGLNLKVHGGHTVGWAQNVREGEPWGIRSSQFSILEAARLSRLTMKSVATPESACLSGGLPSMGLHRFRHD